MIKDKATRLFSRLVTLLLHIFSGIDVFALGFGLYSCSSDFEGVYLFALSLYLRISVFYIVLRLFLAYELMKP